MGLKVKCKNYKTFRKKNRRKSLGSKTGKGVLRLDTKLQS